MFAAPASAVTFWRRWKRQLNRCELEDVTGMKNGNIRKLLFAMGKAGEVR